MLIQKNRALLVCFQNALIIVQKWLTSYWANLYITNTYCTYQSNKKLMRKCNSRKLLLL